MRHLVCFVFFSAFLFCAAFAQTQENPAPGLPPAPGERHEKVNNRPYGKPMWHASGDIFVEMNKIKKTNPEEFARLNELRKTDFKAFIAEMNARLPKRPDFKKIGELKKQERELARKINEEKNPELREKLIAELKAKIKEDFDVMLKEAEARLEMMMQRVTAIRENEEQFLNDKFEMLMRNPKMDGRPAPPEKK